MRLSPSDVLSSTTSVLARSLPACFVSALVFTAPAVLVEHLLLEWRMRRYRELLEPAAGGSTYPFLDVGYVPEDELLRISVIALGLSSLAGAFAIAATQAGVLYPVVERLAGRRAGIGASIVKSLSRLPSALGAVVLVSCAVLFSASCFVVPAFVLAVLFSFAVPAAVVEELSPFRAVARSVDLTEGNRLLIAGLTGGLLLVFAGVRFGLRTAFDAPPALVLEAADLPAALPTFSYHAALGITSLLEAMLLAVLSSVMYARLRQRDGVDAEQLAEVFA
jgi:hypothetical protein